jgi:3-dehydroquinate dehydratase
VHPLVGADEAAVLRELAVILPKRPDLLEWRVDFFTAIADTGRVVALAQAIRAGRRHPAAVHPPLHPRGRPADSAG